MCSAECILHNKTWTDLTEYLSAGACESMAVLVSATDLVSPAGFWTHCEIVIHTHLLIQGAAKKVIPCRILQIFKQPL